MSAILDCVVGLLVAVDLLRLHEWSPTCTTMIKNHVISNNLYQLVWLHIFTASPFFASSQMVARLQIPYLMFLICPVVPSKASTC